MKTIAMGILLVAVVFFNGGTRVQTKPAPPTNVFVGMTPCGEAVRAFVGGGPCQSVIWRLDLGVTERGEPGWSLTAAYGANSASSVGAMPDGLHRSGKLEKLGDTYRLISNNGKSISFRQVSSALIHLLDEQNRLMPGTAGWSYTLSRTDVTDDPGRPERVFGGSYTLSPRETGNTFFRDVWRPHAMHGPRARASHHPQRRVPTFEMARHISPECKYAGADEVQD